MWVYKEICVFYSSHQLLLTILQSGHYKQSVSGCLSCSVLFWLRMLCVCVCEFCGWASIFNRSALKYDLTSTYIYNIYLTANAFYHYHYGYTQNIFIANDALRFSISKQFRFNYVHRRNVNVIKFHLKHMTFNKICVCSVEYYVCNLFACQIQYINNILGLIVVENHFA